MSSLSGKRILLVGASSGIGLSTARMICERGGVVVGVARDAARLEAALKDLGGERCERFPFDVTAFDGLAGLVRAVGPVDGVVHSGGRGFVLPARVVRKSDLDGCMQVHLYAPVLLTLELLKAKALRPGASVVFLSSLAATRVNRGSLPYAMAKAALEVAAKSLTNEFTRRHQVRFNAVSPGLVAVMDNLVQTLGPDRVQEILQSYPLGPGRPQDAASIICFLLSDESRWVSGATFSVDGGLACDIS